VNHRLPAALAAVAAVVLAVLAGRAAACGGEPVAQNLLAPPAVKSALRGAFLAAHPKLDAARVEGPLAGRTYYGSFGGDLYAVATFSVGGRFRGPTILERRMGGPWKAVRDTHGGVCERFVPQPLIATWYLERWRDTDCYVVPA
jgi:hypothetical protein